MFILIISILAAFIISFTCSLLEAAVLSVSNSDIAEISAKNRKTAEIWENFKGNIERPITVILVINTLAHTIGATVSGAKFNQIFGEKWLVIFSVLFSFFMILWTEILPKTVGVRNKKRLAPVIALPLNILIYMMTPIIYILNFFNKPFGIKKADRKDRDILYEINVLAKYAQSNNQLSGEQQKIMERSIEIGSKKIKDIMVNMEKMNFFSNKLSLSEALLKAHIYRHTRYILVENGDIDRIIGYVNFKDIVSALHINPRSATLEGISRPVTMLAEEESVSNAINKLIKNYQHIAVVKNCRGETTGMLTIEDLLESIVGKIEDEYDLIPGDIIKKSETLCFANGGALMSELADRMNLQERFGAVTIHEFLTGLNENILREKDEIQYNELKIKILKVRRDKIFEVMIEKTV